MVRNELIIKDCILMVCNFKRVCEYPHSLRPRDYCHCFRRERWERERENRVKKVLKKKKTFLHVTLGFVGECDDEKVMIKDERCISDFTITMPTIKFYGMNKLRFIKFALPSCAFLYE